MKLREAKKIVRQTARVQDCIHERPYTYISVSAHINGRVYWARAFAKCNPIDEWDAQRGTEITFGRATAQIARQIIAEPSLLAGLVGPTAALVDGPAASIEKAVSA